MSTRSCRACRPSRIVHRLRELEVVQVAERRPRSRSGRTARICVDEVVRRPAPAGAAAPRELRAGGWKRPNSGWSPPFELKWLAITNSCWPLNMNSPASGLRLVVEGRVGRVDAARAESSCGPARAVDDRRRRRRRRRPGRSTNASPRSVRKRKTDADVAARLAAVLVVDRVDLAELVGRAAGGLDRRDQRVVASRRRRRRRCWSAPLLSWISSTATMSGDCRLLTIMRGQRGRTSPAGRSGRGSRR